MAMGMLVPRFMEHELPIFFMFCLFRAQLFKFEFTESTDFEFLAKIFFTVLLINGARGAPSTYGQIGFVDVVVVVVVVVVTMLHIYANTETI